VITAVPAPTPVNKPLVASIVATPGFPVLQVPPTSAFDRDNVAPGQMFAVPVIVATDGFIVITFMV
jgi:hypothetical protein